MFLRRLTLQNFRCFPTCSIDFSATITLLQGKNGIGKTSIVEALYYLCYLRSFRTQTTKELISFTQHTFFTQAELVDAAENTNILQAGFSPAKRVVRYNNTAISSYKELQDIYKVIVVTEDDMQLIKGGPEERRTYIDQSAYLFDTEWGVHLRSYKRILAQRNALLKHHREVQKDEYELWTGQLQEASQILRTTRQQLLTRIEPIVNELLATFLGPTYTLQLSYQQRAWERTMPAKEHILGRTLFGAHLDEITVQFCHTSSRQYASRGQQKVALVLLKVAQIMLLQKHFSGVILFLLDDFMTDFDEQHLDRLVALLTSRKVQLVFTTPLQNSPLHQYIEKQGAQIVRL